MPQSHKAPNGLLAALPPKQRALLALHLRQRGLIQYSRGTLVIVDDKGLEAASCECHRAVSRMFNWLQESEALR